MTRPDEGLLAACRSFLSRIPQNLNYLTAPELQDLLEARPESVFLLDNRTPEAFARGHIHGAVNIWIKEALTDENIARIPTDRTIVVCCWVGHTASQLLTVLQLLGYDAIGLKYGMGEPANPSEPRLGWTDYQFDTDRLEPAQTNDEP
ncbi:rhodanese-like domain-containing protein [Asanoa sp. NPDC049573]|uniref:rhodanese-like domain-containing protein n=1 Tax=Asanoa sp. NPDC049573 TaxID=3155396 RepID=UPI003448C4F6